jgi:hypothetical protein
MDETLLDVALYRHLTGCDRVEPWEIPIGELVWMTAAVARCKGLDLRVTTTADEERLERLKGKRKADPPASLREALRAGTGDRKEI